MLIQPPDFNRDFILEFHVTSMVIQGSGVMVHGGEVYEPLLTTDCTLITIFQPPLFFTGGVCMSKMFSGPTLDGGGRDILGPIGATGKTMNR